MVSKKKAAKEKKSALVRNPRACVFCKTTISDEFNFGGLKSTKNLHAHYYCLLFSQTIYQSGQDNQGILGFMASDIIKELRQSKHKKCCYCQQPGANLGCTHSTCIRKYHLSCGLGNNIQLNFNSFTSLCHRHHKVTNIPVYIKKALNEYHCVICLENFSSSDDISKLIWASCCKSDIVFHINCIKELSLNAGYFTKCPGCNNKNEFVHAIKSLGVFVPERDASWELEGNAFSELLYVHNTCDAENCICPRGRNFVGKGLWKLIRCRLCGSVGTHVNCTPLKRDFLCDICKLDRDSASENPDTVTDVHPELSHTVINVSNESESCEEMEIDVEGPLSNDTPGCDSSSGMDLTSVSTADRTVTDVCSKENASLNECNKMETVEYELQLSGEISELSYFPTSTLQPTERKTNDCESSEQQSLPIHSQQIESYGTDVLKANEKLSFCDKDKSTLPENSINMKKEETAQVNCSTKLNNFIKFVKSVVERHSSAENSSFVIDDQCSEKNDQLLENNCSSSLTSEAVNSIDEDTHLPEIQEKCNVLLDETNELEIAMSPDSKELTQSCPDLTVEEDSDYTNPGVVINRAEKGKENIQDNSRELKPAHHSSFDNIFKSCSQVNTSSDIKMQQRYMPIYRKARKIVKVNFGVHNSFYARVPIQPKYVGYKFNLKLKQRRSLQ